MRPRSELDRVDRDLTATLTADYAISVPLLQLIVQAAHHADRAVAAAGAQLDAVAESLAERYQNGIGECVLVTGTARALIYDAELVPRGAFAPRGKRRPTRAHGLTSKPRTISGRPRRITPS